MPDPVFTHPPDPGIPPPIPAAAPAPSAGAASANSRGRFADPSVPHEERTYALLMHASIVLLHFIFFFSFVVPLVMWLARKDHSRFIDDHGRETLNFHLSITLYGLIGFALIPLCGIGVGVLVGAYVLAIVGGLMACLAASRAEYFRYPMCVRFVR
jgi:uncharacterized protein